MQHKSNTPATEIKSQLSTRDLLVLKRKLPTNWVERIQAKVEYSASRIREVLRDVKKYNPEIIDAAIDVAAEYKVETENGVLAQKKKIQDLTS